MAGDDEAPSLATRNLRGRRSLLVAVGVMLLIAAIGGWLGWAAALVILALAVTCAILLPHGVATDAGVTSDGAMPAEGGDPRLFAAADAMPDPVLVMTSRGVVLHVNTPARQAFPGMVLDRPIAFSVRHPAMVSAIERLATTGAAQEFELHQTVPAEAWYKVHVAPVDGAGRLLATLHNLTEARRIEALRTDFIANASHELRTPLTSLIGFIDTLLGPAAKDAAAREKFLGIMRQQADRMSRLIDDLLSLSRIEMRQHVRPTGRVDLSLLLREVAEGLQTQANDSGTTISLDVGDAPAEVPGDREELYEVFENLLDNAIKYGGDNGAIAIGLEPSASRNALVASVTDRGPGVAAEHVPRLTERFYRVDADTSRRKKGTGLGLAIVKHIVQRHHGELLIKSRPGEGTRVEVLLPR